MPTSTSNSESDNWLMRQLVDAPGDLLIETSFPSARSTTAIKLGKARSDLSSALYPQDLKREPKAFTLTQTHPMGQKRGRGDGSFIKETTGQVISFYRDIVQNLHEWHASAPKLRDETVESGVLGHDIGTETVDSLAGEQALGADESL